MTGLYIHVPFCLRKCAYCDFYSLPLPAAEVRADFFQGLEVELASFSKGWKPDTIYLGGGTPTALSRGELQRLLRMISAHIDLSHVTEWTCEANPRTVTADKAALLRRSGVNRISLGVQSFCDATLQRLERSHTAADARVAFARLRDAGFDNISVDLIFGVPATDRGDVERDLNALVALAPEHVSCYALSLEPGTPLADCVQRGELRALDDDEQARQFRLVRRWLASAGWPPYEISNFSRPGCECRHNLLYWTGGEYRGAGPAAHSHWHGRRYANVSDVASYAKRLRAGRTARGLVERLPPEAKARETLVMGLRLTAGVARTDFHAQTGFDLDALVGGKLEELRRLRLIADDGRRVRLTARGVLVSNAVMAELV